MRRVLAVVLVLSLASFPSWAASLAAQKSERAGLTVTVSPGDLGPAAKVWDFNVVFDTHSQELTDDVAASSVLVDGRGNELKPLAWKGSGPGGHHRAGVLTFKPIEPRPQAIELRIQRSSEAKPHLFRWTLE